MSFKLLICLINLSYKFIYLLFSAVHHPPSAGRCSTLYRVLHFCRKMARSTTQHCLCWPRKFTVFTKKGTNLFVFMVNTNVNCRSCMLIRNIWCWTLDSKVEVSTSIYGGIGTPLITQQPTFGDSKFIFREKRMYREQCWSVKLNVDGHSFMLNSHL